MEFNVDDKVKVIGLQDFNESLIDIEGVVTKIEEGIVVVGFSDYDVTTKNLYCNPKEYCGVGYNMFHWIFSEDEEGDISQKLKKIDKSRLHLV